MLVLTSRISVNIRIYPTNKHTNHLSTCCRWHCWHCCCHHLAKHLGGVWTPPPTLHTHSTQARWGKSWLLTLVEYHWAHYGLVYCTITSLDALLGSPQSTVLAAWEQPTSEWDTCEGS